MEFHEIWCLKILQQNVKCQSWFSLDNFNHHLTCRTTFIFMACCREDWNTFYVKYNFTVKPDRFLDKQNWHCAYIFKYVFLPSTTVFCRHTHSPICKNKQRSLLHFKWVCFIPVIYCYVTTWQAHIRQFVQAFIFLLVYMMWL